MTPEVILETPLPAVPLTVEGASVLHQMMRIKWAAWRALPAAERSAILEEAVAALGAMEKPVDGRQSAVFSMIGHKSDLLFLHFRRSFEELNQAQLELARLRLSDLVLDSESLERSTLAVHEWLGLLWLSVRRVG